MEKSKFIGIGVIVVLIITIFTALEVGRKKSQKYNVTENSQQSLSMKWLKGDWFSKEWQVTYTFHKDKTGWYIMNEGKQIAEDAKVTKESTQKKIVLVSKNGTRFIIEKKDNTHIKFQQLAKEGLIGATARIDFIKK